MYTGPDTPDKIDVKGIQVVRRDSCPLVKDVSNAVLHAIMYDKNQDAAKDAARQHLLRVLSGGVSLDKFIVSKTLRNDYKNDKQPHLYVAKKLGARRGYPVPSGTRVPYVFVEDLDKPDCLQAERAEDPGYVAEHDVPLDLLYYIDHQLASPIRALLELFVQDPDTEIFGHDTIKPLMDALKKRRDDAVRVAKRVRKNKANNQREITSFFKV